MNTRPVRCTLGEKRIMAKYADGFLLCIKKNKLAAYRKLSTKAGKLWMEFGALEYRECAGDDLKTGYGIPFTKLIKLKPGETVVFSWIVYKSRKQRDAVNAKVMKDPRIAGQKDMPFDGKRMIYGGFKSVVDL